MSTDALSLEFKALYDRWGEAIGRHDAAWLEQHFAADFLGTAQPWPTLVVNRAQMLELEKNIETMEVRWLSVTARRLGDVVLATGVVRYMKEAFKEGTAIGDGMPSGSQLSALVNGRSVLYIGAWRHDGHNWQIFDHHMVGIINGLDP